MKRRFIPIRASRLYRALGPQSSGTSTCHVDSGVGRGRGKHEDGWISGNCKGERHKYCTSLACCCGCHVEEAA